MTPSYLFPTTAHALSWLLLSAVVAALVIWRLAPRSWRPAGGGRLAATAVFTTVGAFLAVNVGHRSGFNGWLDYEVIERLGAEVDDTDTWLFSCAVAVLALGVAGLRRRFTDGSSMEPAVEAPGELVDVPVPDDEAR